MRAIVTGANRGIGRGLADRLEAEGYEVVATARSAAAGLAQLDVTDPKSVADFGARMAAVPTDLLVCNAGVYLDKAQSLDQGYDADLWARTFAANVTGVFLTIQALLPNLRAAPKPRIAIISSIMASSLSAPGGSYAYRASKAAALNLGRNLANDLKADGISVGIYHPGWVRTDMGGQTADIDVEASVAGLCARFGELSLASTGAFLNSPLTKSALDASGLV